MEKSNVIEHPGGSVTSIEKRKRKSYFLRIFARVPAVHYEDHREVHIVDILVVAYGGGGCLTVQSERECIFIRVYNVF